MRKPYLNKFLGLNPNGLSSLPLWPLFLPASADDAQARQQKALQLHDCLCTVYGCPISYGHHTLDPMSKLVSARLSHRIKNQASGLAFWQLRDRYPTWEVGRDTPVEAVQVAIAPCTYPTLKAPRWQCILHLVTAQINSN